MKAETATQVEQSRLCFFVSPSRSLLHTLCDARSDLFLIVLALFKHFHLASSLQFWIHVSRVTRLPASQTQKNNNVCAYNANEATQKASCTVKYFLVVGFFFLQSDLVAQPLVIRDSEAASQPTFNHTH